MQQNHWMSLSRLGSPLKISRTATLCVRQQDAVNSQSASSIGLLSDLPASWRLCIEPRYPVPKIGTAAKHRSLAPDLTPCIGLLGPSDVMFCARSLNSRVIMPSWQHAGSLHVLNVRCQVAIQSHQSLLERNGASRCYECRRTDNLSNKIRTIFITNRIHGT